MKRSYIGLALGALVAVGAVLSLPSCAHDQKVVSLTITPTTSTFASRFHSAPCQSHAAVRRNRHVHPSPATKDVTSQATWAIDNDVATMSSPGSSMRRLRRQPLHSTAGPCVSRIYRQVFLRVRRI